MMYSKDGRKSGSWAGDALEVCFYCYHLRDEK